MMSRKSKILYFGLMLLASVFALNSCKKETSCENCNDDNKPPIAIAGPDQVITLPTDSVILDGRSSSDADGTISVWLWKKISGPASFNIISAPSAKTTVQNLVAGTYKFELTVTDNKNASAKDTAIITVDASPTSNHPPVANAANDTTIMLPANTVNLDGSRSTDPDNNITSYQWTKISGPTSFSINNVNAVQTQVTGLTEGLYHFELKVTDAGGLFSNDTMKVTVNFAPVQPCNNNNRPMINAQLIPVGTLSQVRIGISVASAGNKILFAGGWDPNPGGQSSRVDIYDISNNTWSIAELSVARNDMATAALGNKIFFGGGEYGDGTWPVNSVDIYDVSTNTWTIAHLSSAGHSIAAAAVGTKVLFAGGDAGFNGTPGIDRGRQVDIYDVSTNTWSTAQLSDDRVVGHCAVTADNKIYFSGGETWQAGNWSVSNTIDVYDNATNTWSTSTLIQPRMGHTGIALTDKIYWAGGAGSSLAEACDVEIRNINTGNTSVQYLYKPGFWWQGIGQTAVIKNNKILYYRHGDQFPGKFDIYDTSTNIWSIGVLPIDITDFSVISVNNEVYLAGGFVNGVISNQVWKLAF